MKKAVYITGNANKAHYFSKMIGLEIPHHKADVDEIQSLDPLKVIRHKAEQAFSQLKEPVIVEDTFLKFDALGELPGTFIKWFLDELGTEKICRLLDGFTSRGATAGAVIAYYDGEKLEVFSRSLKGSIADKPRGTSGFGWNVIFIPEGSLLTLGEMSDKEFVIYYKQIKPFDQIKEFLLK